VNRVAEPRRRIVPVAKPLPLAVLREEFGAEADGLTDDELREIGEAITRQVAAVFLMVTP
jgi:hypothetical protein